eukprot:gene17771-19547_t
MSGKQEKRPMIGAMFRGPGPCYGLPEAIGYQRHDFTKSKAPAYSFGVRGNFKHKDECSPGPAYFIPEKLTRGGPDGAPKYSLKSRPNVQNSFRTPGPDAYRAESVAPLKERRAPAYSFGSRTRYSQKDNNPSPSQYSLPNLTSCKVPHKRTMPCFSMTGRSKIGGFHEDLQKTPGPGTYKVTEPKLYKKRHPEYSMGGRCVMPGDTTQKPGPGSHSPEKVYVTKKIAPKFSFGIRHSEFTAPLIFAHD